MFAPTQMKLVLRARENLVVADGNHGRGHRPCKRAKDVLLGIDQFVHAAARMFEKNTLARP
jgi:hypothetical protein